MGERGPSLLGTTVVSAVAPHVRADQETALQQDIQHVGIVGCGTMGGGIAQIVASHGFTVSFVESDDAAVERGSARIAASTCAMAGWKTAV